MSSKRVFENFGLITREVKRGELNGRQTYTMVSESTFDTSVRDLWDAITNKERLPRWFAPVEGDLVLGGHYRIESNASGQITHCAEETGFEVTWEFAGETSWVKVSLSTISDEKSLLHLEHRTIAEGEHFEIYGPGATGVGWDLALCALNFHIETGESIDENALLPTPEGKDFISVSAKGWGEASEVAGYDPDWSRDAAKKTEKFFLGE